MRASPLPRRQAHARRDRSGPAAQPLMSPRERAMTALAYAFLDGDWTVEGLTRRGAIVLGHSQPPFRKLVDSVLRAYPRPPWDRARELTAWLLAIDLQRDDADWTLLFSPTRWLTYQHAIGEMGWPVPAMPTLGELTLFRTHQLGARVVCRHSIAR